MADSPSGWTPRQVSETRTSSGFIHPPEPPPKLRNLGESKGEDYVRTSHEIPHSMAPAMVGAASENAERNVEFIDPAGRDNASTSSESEDDKSNGPPTGAKCTFSDMTDEQKGSFWNIISYFIYRLRHTINFIARQKLGFSWARQR